MTRLSDLIANQIERPQIVLHARVWFHSDRQLYKISTGKTSFKR
ncbi:MAG TPA: hypothetical protein VKM55_14770 [Candidatus Lokiarchaeia archaeon]|nr:hypothetical protein [Candidatus Lokiarchaeia archaeon]